MAKTREDYLRYEAAARTLAEAAETAEEREYFLGRAALHRSRAEGCAEEAPLRMACIRSIKHVVHCQDCRETWVDEECTCTCSGPELETWTVTELQAPLRFAGGDCADCGRPLSGHPGYLSRAERDTGPSGIPLLPDSVNAKRFPPKPFVLGDVHAPGPPWVSQD